MAKKTQGSGRIAGSTALRRCLGATMASGALLLASATPAAAQGMTICHATGNPGAPFIQITVGPEGPGPHGVHEGDLIPAPAGGCPTSLEPAATPVPTVEAVPVVEPAPEPDTAVTSPAVEVEPRSTETAAEQRSSAREVRRARRQRRAARRAQAAEPAPAPAPAAAAPAVAQARPVRARLPFTGYETLFVAMTGVGFVMLGAGMRLTALRDGR